jgi:hypothetical protein
VQGTTVPLSVRVASGAKLSAVYVYYKRMPSSYEFVRLEMHPTAAVQYTAAVPLTPEGILYYFEAIDEDGNAANYPNFLESTPYFVIDSWSPLVGAAGAR